MKWFEITYICEITKSTRKIQLQEESISKAKKKFKDAYYVVPRILSVTVLDK